MNGIECGRKWSWPNTKYYTSNRLGGLRKTQIKPQTLQLVFVPRYAPRTFHTQSRCLPLQWDTGWQLVKIYPVFYKNKQTNKQQFIVLLKNSQRSTTSRTSTTSFCCTVILQHYTSKHLYFYKLSSFFQSIQKFCTLICVRTTCSAHRTSISNGHGSFYSPHLPPAILVSVAIGDVTLTQNIIQTTSEINDKIYKRLSE